MPANQAPLLAIEFQPVTPERWHDLEALFGESRVCSNCWCMWFRMTRSEFSKQVGQQKKEAMRRIVDSGEVPDLLAYAGGEAIAWCSVAPREAYPSLERSRVLKRIDDAPVWSIVCFFVARPFRRYGLMSKLIEAAVAYAREHGATIVEAYPIDSRKTRLTSSGAYTGVASAFQKAGFVEALRRSERQPIMRYHVK